MLTSLMPGSAYMDCDLGDLRIGTHCVLHDADRSPVLVVWATTHEVGVALTCNGVVVPVPGAIRGLPADTPCMIEL
jgi:hypothetical protein